MSANRTMKPGASPIRVARRAWTWLRQVTGDADYENYLRHATMSAPERKTLSQRDFYLESLRRRYSTISRCC